MLDATLVPVRSDADIAADLAAEWVVIGEYVRLANAGHSVIPPLWCNPDCEGCSRLLKWDRLVSLYLRPKR